MSRRTKQPSTSGRRSESVAGLIEDWYHVPVLLVLLGVMFYTRVQGWKNFVIGDKVFFSGNDAWYHLRQVTYTVRNWPSTMPFDPWTHFPVGTSVGQFGTLYDQIVATVALIVGLGSPDQHTIGLTLLFAPAVFGTLVAIPAYFIGKRLGGRFGGVVAVLILALAPSEFLRRSLVGFSDHHVAEAFFQSIAVLAVMVAVSVAEREKPVYEQFQERDWENLRSPVGWAALAGVAISLYIWTWPPGVLLVGILGLFFTITLTLVYVRGESPEHLAIAGAVMMSVVGILSLLAFDSFALSPTQFTLIQPALAFAVAAGCLFLAFLARKLDETDYSPYVYPGIIASIISATALVLMLAAPDVFDFFVAQFARVAGFGSSATAQTVGEAQPLRLSDAQNYLTFSYGLTFYTGVVGAVVMLVQYFYAGERRAEYLFVLTWAVVMTMAAFTQVRFNYYLIVAIAAMNAFLAGGILRYVSPDRAVRSVRDIELYQVLTVVAVLLVVTGPLTLGGTNAIAYGGQVSQPGEVTEWDDSLEWLSNETPEEGTYGGAQNEMELYGQFQQTENYEYPDGAYGVMSWWDYGHFITVKGERIPDANPFQQSATKAANYLLATNETQANDLLVSEQGEETRYVMIDWKLADPSSNKYSAPTVFYDRENLTSRDMLTPVFNQQGSRLVTTVQSQRHYDSMRTRLYYHHGSSIEVEPVVSDWETATINTQRGPISFPAMPSSANTSAVKRFETMEEAQAYVESDPTSQIGGIGPYPSERVPALQHYRLVKVSNTSALSSPTFQQSFFVRAQLLGQAGLSTGELFRTPPSWVKTFEKVPGATVEGTGPANTTITAAVQMRMPTTNSTFTYTQQAQTDENGQFTMTLPYSTTGYDEYGLDAGYTNVSVQANGPYTFTSPLERDSNLTGTQWRGTADVSEGQVLGEEESAVEVSLSEETVDIPEGAQNGTDDGNATNGTDGNVTTPPNGTNTTDGDETNTTTGTNNTTAQSLTASTWQATDGLAAATMLVALP
ncbi:MULTISPECIES: oligosaccharyl transferase, archaeosortase A system-associated [unclassified Haladaptatus]|uniref:oligosaccharyl transferase, archaeosortase A system-associated n=1 Tax=unclassified Haladaptatus TaxID=2622732 RepID=UPI00360EB2AB